MNQEIDWYGRSGLRRGFKGRDEFNTYNDRVYNPFNHGTRNPYNQFQHPYLQNGNSYGSGIRQDPMNYGLVRPVTGITTPAETAAPLVNQESSTPEIPPCIPSRELVSGPAGIEASKIYPLRDESLFPKSTAANFDMKDCTFVTPSSGNQSMAWKQSIGHGDVPLIPILNLEIHTPHEPSPIFPPDTRVPPPPIGHLDVAIPPQTLLTTFNAPPPMQPEIQQVANGRNQRWSNNKKEVSPVLDVQSSVSERSNASTSASVTSFRSNVKEENNDDDDDVICLTDLNAKSNSPPLDTFLKFLDSSYSGLFKILDRVSGNELLPIMETFIKNLDKEFCEIDDKIRLWMHLNVVMISATQGISLVNLELENYLNLMERFSDTYFKLMKQIFQQAWKLGQIPDCKDIAVNCILVLSRCFLNRYDRILNCFLERQIPMDVKGLPQVWCQILSYLLTVPVDNFLEEDGYRIYLIWQKFRALCETTQFVQKMDKVVTKRLRETGSLTGNFYIKDILKKQRSNKNYNWWDMSQDYFKYMEGKNRTALESYNYSYMYPGNPEAPSSCYITPSRISQNFKPFYESLSAWSRDDEVARIFDRAETEFTSTKREMEKGYNFPKIDLLVIPDYVDSHFVPPKPNLIVRQAMRKFSQKQFTPNKTKILRNLSTIVISDSDSEDDDDHLSLHSSSGFDKIVDLTLIDEEDVVITVTSGIDKDNSVSFTKEILHDTLQQRIDEVVHCSKTAEIEVDSQGSKVDKIEENPNKLDENCISVPEDILMCQETLNQKQQEQSEAIKEQIDILHKITPESPSKITQISEQCDNGTNLNIISNNIQHSGQSSTNEERESHLFELSHPLTQDTRELLKSNEKQHIEEKLNGLCAISANEYLQMNSTGTENINSNEGGLQTHNDRISNISCTILDRCNVGKNSLNDPNNPKPLEEEEYISSQENGSIRSNIVNGKCGSDVIMNSCPDKHQASHLVALTETNANTLDSIVSGKVPFNESSATNDSIQEISLEKNTSTKIDVTPLRMEVDNLESCSPMSNVATNIEDTAQTSISFQSCSTENKLNGQVISTSAVLKSDSEVQNIILTKSIPNKLDSAPAEADGSEINRLQEKCFLLNDNNRILNENDSNASDVSSPSISEHILEEYKSLMPIILNPSTAEMAGAEQSMPNQQDQTALTSSALNESISEELGTHICRALRNCLHEDTLLSNSNELNPNPAEVNSLEEIIKMKSSESDVKILTVEEVQTGTLRKCGENQLNVIGVELCPLEVNKISVEESQITDNISEIEQNSVEERHSPELPADIVPDKSSTAVATEQFVEPNVDGCQPTESFEKSAPQMLHWMQSEQYEEEITRSACIVDEKQTLCANYYSCVYIQAPCSKSNSWRDNSVLSDESSQESNADIIRKPIKDNCKQLKKSRKRKLDNCESPVGIKRSNITWWPKSSNEGVLPSKTIPDDLSDTENGLDDYKLPDTSDIASPPFEVLDKNKVKTHFEEGMKRQTLIDWKSTELNSSSYSSTTNDTSSSISDGSNYETPMDLRNMSKSSVDTPLEETGKIIAEQPSNCRDLYEGFLKNEAGGGEADGISSLLTPEWTFDQSQYINKDTVKGNRAPGTTSQSFLPESQISVLDDTGVNPEGSALLYPSESATSAYSSKKSSVTRYRSEEKNKVHFSGGLDELFQNGLEGPVGKPIAHMGEKAPNFLWSDSEPPYSLSVKHDNQLMEQGSVKLESILKKPKVKNTDNCAKVSSTISTDVLDQRRLYEKQHEDLFYQSYFNESQGFNLNEIGADPYPYLGLPVVFGDGFKTPSPAEDIALAGSDSLGVKKDNALVMGFNSYEPAEVPLKYPKQELTPVPSNEFQIQREPVQEVKLALPPKKRKLTEEEELKIIVAKYMEDLEQSQKLQKSYPAERQMSIADLQRDCPKIRTLAARKEYPTVDQLYQKQAQPTLNEEQNVSYQKYPDQCPDQRGTITNFFINGVQHFSHKVNMPSAKPFWVMLGPIDSEGQCTTPQEAPLIDQNTAVPATMPALPPIKVKRGRKPSGVPKPPGVKRGRGRPRKNPL